MRRLPLLLLLVSGCATVPHAPMPGPSAGSTLVGTWLLIEKPDDRSMIACASGLPIAYASNGTYALFEEGGVWRLVGDRLTETATEVTEAGDPKEVQIGRAFVSRISWTSRDEFVKTTAEGEKMVFRRCPPQ